MLPVKGAPPANLGKKVFPAFSDTAFCTYFAPTLFPNPPFSEFSQTPP